jgi:hypothetical protein
MIDTIAFILATLTSTSTATFSRTIEAPSMHDVINCDNGSMTLQDNGWLVDAMGNKVNFHYLMDDQNMAGIDAKTAIDASIQVCQDDHKLVYSVK